MIAKEDIVRIVKPKIKEIGGYLVDVKINTNNIITIYIDSIKGVLVEDCLQVSRHFEENFDREIEDYGLTVCSSGLERPFVVPEQYKKNIGNEVKVLLKNGKRERGVILSYDKELVLDVVKKNKNNKKKDIMSELRIAKEDIKETKLKINFK